MSTSSPVSEEDVRQLISRYVMQLGFDINEIRHEQKTITIEAFSNAEIRIGKKNRQLAHGRIDILVRNEDKVPLFVVEVKEPNTEILEGKDQALSYARLLLAPLVVITNGKDTKLFDPSTEEELTDAKEAVGCKNNFRIDISDDIRYEAFQNFIGYNIQNLLGFCEMQRAKRVSYLKGSREDADKKYIPELYVAPTDLEQAFCNFSTLVQPKKVFLIHGESGSGKTNSICYLSELIGSQYPVLFYAATLMGRPIGEEIETDFNYHFSAERSFISIMKRVRKIIEKHSTKLFIFIDAIDEYQGSDVMISDFFHEIEDLKDVFLCISAKTSRIRDFLYVNDVPTIALSYEEYVCRKLSYDELTSLLAKYSAFFSTKGQVTGELRELCRQPFFLRILHEVYQHSQIPVNIAPLELIEYFLQKKLNKIPSQLHTTSRVLLSRIAELMYERNAIFVFDRDIYDAFPQNAENALNALVDQYVLLKEGTRLSFYFDRIRDYLFAFDVRKWNLMSPIDLEEELKKVSSSLIAQTALIWYFDVASDEHKRVMSDLVEVRALKYVERYEYYLNRYFKELRSGLEPNNEGKIGMLLFRNLDGNKLEDFALIPILDTDASLQFEEINKNGYNEIYKILERRGGRTIYGGVLDFIAYDDIDKRVKRHILDQIYNLIDNRLLLEGEHLLVERLLEIIFDYRLELGYLKPKDYLNTPLDFWNNIFPLDVNYFRNYHLSYLFLWAKHAIDIFNEKYREKLPGTRAYGRTKPYNLHNMTSLMASEYEEIARRVKEEVSNGLWKGTIWISDIQIDLIKIMADAIFQKRRVIERPLLPQGDLKLISPRKGPWSISEYSSQAMKDYLLEFFRLFTIQCRELASKNFPDLKEYLPLYGNLPTHIIIEYDLAGGQIPSSSFSYVIIKNTNANTDEIEVYEKGQQEIFHRDVDSFYANTKYGRKDLKYLHSVAMTMIFEKYALQKWCYEALREDIAMAVSRLT